MKTGNLVTDSKNMNSGKFLTENDLGFLHNRIILIGIDMIEQMELLSMSKTFDISGMCVALNSDTSNTHSLTFTTSEVYYGWGILYSQVFEPDTDDAIDISWNYKRVISGKNFVLNIGARCCCLFHFFRLFTTG